jgi:hypothetical protein
MIPALCLIYRVSIGYARGIDTPKDKDKEKEKDKDIDIDIDPAYCPALSRFSIRQAQCRRSCRASRDSCFDSFFSVL